MSIYAETSASSTYTPVPEGNHIARCFSMVDLGTQANKFDPSKPAQRKVRLGFEIPGELREDGKPHTIQQKMTLTMHEKGSLRKFLQSWRGKPFTEEEAKRFDITKLLGLACMLNVLHEQKADKTYANIASVAALPKGVTAPPPISPRVEFSLDPAHFDAAVFASLPEYVQDEVKQSPEYAALAGGAAVAVPAGVESEENDLPF